MHGPACVAHNALHLWVAAVACHKQRFSLGARAGCNAVYFGHKGAGGVMHGHLQGRQLVIYALRHAVAAYHHLIPRGHLARQGRGNGATALQRCV